MTTHELSSQDYAAVTSNEKGQMATVNLFANADLLLRVERMATIMANGLATIPDHLRGKPDDCYAICLQALQWGMNPWPVAQKTYVINGILGYEAQLVNAVVVNSGVIEGRFAYEKIGDWSKILGKVKSVKNDKGKIYHIPNWNPDDEQGLGVRLTATLKGEDEPTEFELFLTQAQVRNSTLWASDPYQQLCYLAVKRFARLYAPDVILGVYTPDELQERQEKEVNPVESNKLSKLAKKANALRRPENEQQQSAKEEAAPSYSPLALELLDKLKICESMSELQKVVNEITNQPEWNEHDKNLLNAAYKQEGSRIKQALADEAAA